MNFIKNNFSKTCLIIIIIIITTIKISHPPQNELSWDVFGYYLYLPAKFIYHDSGFTNKEWLDTIYNKYQVSTTQYQLVDGVNNFRLIKYSMGMSYLYSPFFFIGHAIAKSFGYPPDGLSPPYQMSVYFGMLLYTILGLIFLRKILLYFFNDKLTGLILLLIVFSTNYILQCTTYRSMLSHNGVFMLVSFFIWISLVWSKKATIINSIFLGLVSGMIIITRPNEIVCILFLLLIGVSGLKGIKDKIIFFLKRWKYLIISMIAFFIVIYPQLYYWKIFSGKWIFYSYNNPGEGFDFLTPYTLDFLFSFRKGWIIYTPLVIFMIYGFKFLYRNKKEVFYSILTYTLVSLFIVSSWTCWWYAGGCYSQRAIISLYIVLVIPLGYLIQQIQKSKVHIKIIFWIIIGLIVLLNLFQYWQTYNGILPTDRITARYYFKIFGQTKAHPEWDSFLLVDKENTGVDLGNNTLYSKKIIGTFDFSKPNGEKKDKYITDTSFLGRKCFQMDSSCDFSPKVEMKYKEITKEYYAWIRVNFDMYLPDSSEVEPPLLVITYLHKNENYSYQTFRISDDKIEKNKWISCYFSKITPDIRNKNDLLNVYFWYRMKKPVYISNFQVEVCEPIIK